MDNNKNKIRNFLNKENFKLGCYDPRIEIFGTIKLNKILKSVEFDSQDIFIKYKNKKYVLEVSVVDDEVDFTLYSLNEYLSIYGDEYLEAAEWV